MSKRRKCVAVALLFGVVVAGLIVFAFADIGQSAAFPFRSVTPAELARGGVTLSAATPPANLPTTASGAVATVTKFQGGRRVLEVHYARCVDSQKVPRLDQDCWAVAIDPHGLRGHGGPAVMANGHFKVRRKHAQAFHYDVVFVDANSGKVIEATLGS
jgi:hypothetical protein